MSGRDTIDTNINESTSSLYEYTLFSTFFKLQERKTKPVSAGVL